MACILGQSQMDLVSVVSGLLHDTVEDTALTLSELDALFGVETRRTRSEVDKEPPTLQGQYEDLPCTGWWPQHYQHTIGLPGPSPAQPP